MEEIGKILPQVLRHQLSCLEPPVVEVLAPLWARVAGKALAKECQPVAFSRGTLTLATQNADWAEPLRQMAEEIRAHVNDFLGQPVVENLRILRIRKPNHGDVSPWGRENPPVSQPHRDGWPGKVSRMVADMAEGRGRSRPKHFGRKGGKVR